MRTANYQLVRRLFYYDSEDELTELLIKDGNFTGFVVAPQK